jgi:CubicO group peptidase (beta-lactamase class C family)
MKTSLLIFFTSLLFVFPSSSFEFSDSFKMPRISKKDKLHDWANNPQIDRIVLDEMVKQNIPGIAVGVIKDGNIIHTQGYGYTDLERKTKLTKNTPIRWASISKTLTAVATLQMMEEGIIRLGGKVHYALESWPDTKRKVDVSYQHLLLNASGIQHYGDGVEEDNIYNYNASAYVTDDDQFNAEKAVQVFNSADLDFFPGTNYLYSTLGFNLLGAALDKKTSKGYVGWVKEHIAAEAQMASLNVSSRSRSGFQKSCDGRLNKKTEPSVEWKLPGGGWESSVVDLSRFAQGIINNTFLDKTDRLWSVKSRDHDTFHYGINKRGSDDGNDLRIWHGGSHNNLRTLLHIYPNRKEGIVIMCNANYADCWRILDRIYSTVLGINRSYDASPVDLCNSRMESCSEQFAGIWRKTNKDVIIRRGYTHKAFLTEWQFLKEQGYYCEDFEAYTIKNQLLWDGIFKKGRKKTAMWRNFDQAEFNKKWKEQTSKGYRLIDLETYSVNGRRKWAGLFVEGQGKHALYRNLDHGTFNQKHREMAGAGRKLIDVEVHGKDGKLYWSGVWTEGAKSLLYRNYSQTNFNKLWKEKSSEGYRLIDIETYVINGQQKWAGVWEKSTQPAKLNRNTDFCSLMDKHEGYSKTGYELIDLEAY